MKKYIGILGCAFLTSITSIQAVRFYDAEDMQKSIKLASDEEKYNTTVSIFLFRKDMHVAHTGILLDEETVLTTAHSIVSAYKTNKPLLFGNVHLGPKIKGNDSDLMAQNIEEKNPNKSFVVGIKVHPDFKMYQEERKDYLLTDTTVGDFDYRFDYCKPEVGGTIWKFSGPDLAILKIQPLKLDSSFKFLKIWEKSPDNLKSLTEPTLVSYGSLGINNENFLNRDPIERHLASMTVHYSKKNDLFFSAYMSFEGTRDSFEKDEKKSGLQGIILSGDSGAPLITKQDDEYYIIGINSRYMQEQFPSSGYLFPNFDIMVPVAPYAKWINSFMKK